MTKRKHVCKFCKTAFTRESTLITHMCTKKQRWLHQKDAHVQAGFKTWLHMIGKTTRPTKKQYTMEDFINDSLYMDFVKYGRHAINLGVNFIDFATFLLDGGYKIKDWIKDTPFNHYMSEKVAKEDPATGIARSINYLTKWSEDTGNDITDFFRLVNPNQAVFIITSFKISPWMILCCPSASCLFDRLNEEQVVMINQKINLAQWSAKIKRYNNSFEEMRKIMEEEGL